MKNICVITGASSGIGLQFFKALSKKPYSFDEIWVIARRKEKLEELKNETKVPIKVLALDLSHKSSYDVYKAELEKEKPNVEMLVSNSGFGKMGATVDIGLEENLNMIDINVEGTVSVDIITIPFMSKGSVIINLASIAAWQPAAYFNTYASTKAFILSFSRALCTELRPKGIHVIAVCPFWTKSDFFERSVIDTDNPVIKKYIVWYEANDVVNRALKDAQKKKFVSKYGVINELQSTAAKHLPYSIIEYIWCKQQDLPYKSK